MTIKNFQFTKMSIGDDKSNESLGSAHWRIFIQRQFHLQLFSRQRMFEFSYKKDFKTSDDIREMLKNHIYCNLI